jgi:hypothetical protein
MNLYVPSTCNPPTRLRVYLNARRLWRWHIWLLEAVTEAFQAPEVFLIDSGPALPGAVKILLTLERLVFRLSGEHACDLVDKSAISCTDYNIQRDTKTSEIILNLSGRDLPDIFAENVSQRILCPFFDGSPTDDALIAALLDEHIPTIAIRDVNHPEQVWCALPAVQNRNALTSALDNVFSALMRLCVKAVSSANSSPVWSENGLPVVVPRSPACSPLQFESRVIAQKVKATLTGLCTRAPRWFTNWRWAADDRIHLTFQLPKSGYHRIQDDGRRCYADPFVINEKGQHHIFLEEFDFSLGRGVISTTAVAPGGELGVPRVVLERPHHLSYPFIFKHDEHIWMIPESSAARTVELYRADPFPDRWVLEATLLKNITVADASVFFHHDRWWMLASTVERQSSSWDSLSVF